MTLPLLLCLLAPLPAERWHVQPGEWEAVVTCTKGKDTQFALSLLPDGTAKYKDRLGQCEGRWKAKGNTLTILADGELNGEPLLYEMTITMDVATGREIHGRVSVCGFPSGAIVMRRKP